MRSILIGAVIVLGSLVLSACGDLFLRGDETVVLDPGYAIIYGVAEYSEIKDLNFSDDDANDVHAMLSSGLQGFDAENVIIRTNAEATKTQLELDFDEIVRRMESNGDLTELSNTRFFFYFAGHGYGDGMTGLYSWPEPWQQYLADDAENSEPVGAGTGNDYLFLHDISIDGPSSAAEVDSELVDSAVSDDELAIELAAIPSRQRIVVIDACHSGGFIGDGTAVDSVPRAYSGDGRGVSFFDRLDALSSYAGRGSTDIGPDTVVLTAAGEQEFSYEYLIGMGIENGVFTHYFLQTPSLADGNSDGLVTVSEAYSHTVQAIESQENPYLSGDGKFLPRLSSPAVDFVLFKAE